MRDILFRGKRTDNGKWVYGDIIHRRYYKNTDVVVIRTEDSGFDNYSDYEVDPETVGQFTGLTDKNGKKIFEGDICRMKADRLKGYGAIIFMGSAFVLCDKTHKQTRYYPLYPDGQFTVVGNIHDNPEMLEVTK